MTSLEKNTSFVCTSNRGYAQPAQEELRRLFPEARFYYLAPAEVFVMTVPNDRETVIDTVRQHEPMFLRHLFPAMAEMPQHGTDHDLAVLQEAAREFGPQLQGKRIAVQVRKADGLNMAYAPSDAKRALDDALSAAFDTEAVVQSADWILSVYISPGRIQIGCSSPDDNLSDWPGGAIRFQREEGQISRAKFKLLEAERTFGLDYSLFRRAVDIGAAPGGWTSLLLERGVRVTSVDPAKLHPSLTGHPRLTYLPKNAGKVEFKHEEFDLLVCDMSWSPRQMAKLINDLLYALAAGGTAVVTVKLMHKKPLQTVREIVQAFSQQLELVKGKQLFHNREELTLYFVKRL